MLGTLLAGRYKIITILGAGGFGQTYLAEDIQQAHRCVVKQFQPTSQDKKFLEVARRLFQTEVDTLRRLGVHEQIPALYDFFEDSKEFYLVQEFIEGHSLANEFSRRHQLTEGEVIAIIQDVLEVLQFVHQNQVIHRDIKPGNLIRRSQDGKIILIDFGAVKEIHTQMATSVSGMTSFTIGIGTQGYTPSEQLMGRPRYCSDIYALGMTAIQALTGLSPSQLPDDPNTLDIAWQDKTDISPGLKFILDRMVRYDYNQRYPSVEDVQRALLRLSDVPTNITDVEDVPAELLLPDGLLHQQLLTQPVRPESWREMVKAGVKAIAIATLAVSGFLLGIRQIGWTEPMEMAAYDQMTRLQPVAGPDPRLLVVSITETDLQNIQRVTPSDRTLAEALEILQALEPRVIGVDLLRDIPQDPGRAEFLQQLQANNVVAIMKLGDSNNGLIPAPSSVPPDRVGFNDFPIDSDNVIRRNLLFASADNQSYFSFATRLALKYLETENIAPITIEDKDGSEDVIQLGDALLRPLEKTSGGYQNADAGGYQILLRYRASGSPGRVITLTDVLDGNFEPEWIQDKVILIGTTAPSAKDLFYTPYSASQQDVHQMAGVVVHAHMTGQLIGAALGDQVLFWYFPGWAEMLWVVAWSAVGGVLGWFVRHPIILGGSSTVWLVVIVGVGVVLFSQGAWIPVVVPAIAFLLTDAGVAVFRLYRDYRRQSFHTRILAHPLTQQITQTFHNPQK